MSNPSREVNIDVVSTEMSNQPLVSILINNYNYGNFLGDAIVSVINQTYSQIEIIVVDDGSTDHSRDVIDSFGDNIVAICKENGGQASAMNAGFNKSTGDIICLLDADDLFFPEKVSFVVEQFEENPEIEWVFVESVPKRSQQIVEIKDNNVFDKSIESDDFIESPKPIDFRDEFSRGHLPDFTPSTSNLCFSRALTSKIFPLPEIKGLSGMAITDLYIKLLAVGLSKGIRSTAKLGIYRLHDSYYSALEKQKKQRMFAEIYMTTGYWFQQNFPTTTANISKKLIARGHATYILCNGSQFNTSDADCHTMIRDYLQSSSLFDRFKTRMMILYYLLKLKRD